MYRDRKGNYHKIPSNIIAKKRKSAYGIFIKDSKILLVKPSWVDIWEFPGGGKDHNESLFDTLKREFLEETGFEIIDFDKNPIKVINTKFYADDLSEYFDSEMSFFMIKKLGNQNKNLIDNNEIVDLKNISIPVLNKKNMNNIHFDILDIIKNGQN
jgi:8-oxo-dGTP pyrophosphatase MutT (NUDIX family)